MANIKKSPQLPAPARGATVAERLRFYKDHQLPVYVAISGGENLRVMAPGRVSDWTIKDIGAGVVVYTIRLQCYVQRNLCEVLITAPEHRIHVLALEAE
jgi:uncharacterized protein (DUF1786 family)